MNNFLKGILVGIANIAPGISGSLLLIVFNLYDKCLNAIATILKNPKKSIIFLTPIALGIITGTYLFSNVISFFLEKEPTITSLTFAGLIFGTIPQLIKESTKKGFKEKYLITFFITFTIGIILLFYKNSTTITTIEPNIINLILVGFLLSASTIIPGISSTVLLSIIGMYEIYINAISTINIPILIPILIGLIISSFFLSKIINYLINKYYGATYFAILGFAISTIPALIKQNLVLNKDLIIGILFAIIAFIITNYSFKLK